MKKIIFLLCFCSYYSAIFSQAEKVTLDKNESGIKLKVDGQDFFINGMNWDYFPIGTNYSYILWEQPEEIIKKALANEMTLLKNMNGK